MLPLNCLVDAASSNDHYSSKFNPRWRIANYQIQFKRVYDAPATSDGIRVLADRLWPRDMKQVALACDDCCSDACASRQLREGYHAQISDWPTFFQAYGDELAANPAVLS